MASPPPSAGGNGLDFTITNDNTSKAPPEGPQEPDPPKEPEDPNNPESPNTPDTPGDPDHPVHSDHSDIPQTGVNWRLVWLLASAGAPLVLVGIGKELRRKGKHEL